MTDDLTDLEWWTSPALAYAKGLRDGAQLVVERLAEEDEALHRAAVRRIEVTIEKADARRAADSLVRRPDDYPGRAA